MIRWRGMSKDIWHGDPGCGFLRPEEVLELLDGRLAERRLAAFEKHEADGCGPCSLLAADMKVYQEVVEEGLLEGEIQEFEATRWRTLDNLRQAAAGTASRRRLLIVAAAAVACITLLTWPILRQPSRIVTVTLPNGSDIVVDALPFSAPPVLRGEQAPLRLWPKAEEAYLSGRYLKAARYLRAIEEAQPGNADTALYMGISLLMAGRAEEARAELAKARERAAAQDLPQSAAAWYEALAALAENDPAGARRSFMAAAEEGGPYGTRAEQALATWSIEP